MTDDAELLCPSCRYDLRGTIGAGLWQCPECGYEFDEEELERGLIESYWSVGTGLRRAARAMSIRAIILLPLWTLFIWLVTPIINFLPRGGMVGMLVVGPGVIVGHVLSRRIVEITGCVTRVVTAMGISYAVVLTAAGVEIAGLGRTITWPMEVFVILIVSSVASLWIAHATWLRHR